MDDYLSVFTKYFIYFGLPLLVAAAMCNLSCLTRRKRRAALQGKVVVITGASSGIGEALAHAFYEHGCKVVLAARRISELERVKQELMTKPKVASPLEPVALALDLADLNQIEPFAQKVYELCGSIDILINNGGVSHWDSILNTKFDIHKQIMTINYFGSVALTIAVLPKMVAKKSGHIAFISSIQGLIAIPDFSAYSASKHAMQAFGDCLRAEMHQHNINVTMVSPGYVRTAVSVNAIVGSGETYGVMDSNIATGLTTEYVANRILDSIVCKQNELIVSQFIPKFAIFLRRFMPSLYFRAMTWRAKPTQS